MATNIEISNENSDLSLKNCIQDSKIKNDASLGVVSLRQKNVPPPESYHLSLHNLWVDNQPERKLSSQITVPPLSEAEIRDILLKYVQKIFRYGTKAVKEMKIMTMHSTIVYHYTFESFLESRSIKWVNSPFSGNNKPDEVLQQTVPNVWDINVPYKALFGEGKCDVDIHNSTNVRPCIKCHRNGVVKCQLCKHSILINCTNDDNVLIDNANGTDNGEKISKLTASANSSDLYKSKCEVCHSTGLIPCKLCAGSGYLSSRAVLKIKWTNHGHEYVDQYSLQMPNEILSKVSGQLLYEDEQPQLHCLRKFQMSNLMQVSQHFIDEQRKEYGSTHRLLRQRHKVYGIPVTHCRYMWRDKEYQFYIYGFNNDVYASDYPDKMLCCII